MKRLILMLGIFILLPISSVSTDLKPSDLNYLPDDYLTDQPGLLPGERFYFMDVFLDDFKFKFDNYFNKEKCLEEALEVSNERTAEIIDLANLGDYENMLIGIKEREKYLMYANESLTYLDMKKENHSMAILFSETIIRQGLAIETTKEILRAKLITLQRDTKHSKLSEEKIINVLDNLDGVISYNSDINAHASEHTQDALQRLIKNLDKATN